MERPGQSDMCASAQCPGCVGSIPIPIPTGVYLWFPEDPKSHLSTDHWPITFDQYRSVQI